MINQHIKTLILVISVINLLSTASMAAMETVLTEAPSKAYTAANSTDAMDVASIESAQKKFLGAGGEEICNALIAINSNQLSRDFQTYFHYCEDIYKACCQHVLRDHDLLNCFNNNNPIETMTKKLIPDFSLKLSYSEDNTSLQNLYSVFKSLSTEQAAQFQALIKLQYAFLTYVLKNPNSLECLLSDPHPVLSQRYGGASTLMTQGTSLAAVALFLFIGVLFKRINGVEHGFSDVGTISLCASAFCFTLWCICNYHSYTATNHIRQPLVNQKKNLKKIIQLQVETEIALETV